MVMIKEYKIVKDSDLGIMTRIVNGLIADGWYPIGGLAVRGCDLYQAMALDYEEWV